MPRGIPEVPMHLDKRTRDLLVNLREQVIELRNAQAPLPSPTNIKGTAQAFSNLIQWTRPPGADGFEVLWNHTPSLSGAAVIDVGNSAQWVDHVGNANVTRTYWVRAYRKSSGAKSTESSPVTLTTLASATGVTPPNPPPPGQILVIDQRTGQAVPYVLSTGRFNRGAV